MSRWVYAVLGLAVLGLAGFMISRALTESLVYFVLPNEVEQEVAQDSQRRMRLGGIVRPGSVAFDGEDLVLAFDVTDTIATFPVRHSGTPPELFEENTGVVVEGRFENGTFVSDTLLVKHSEVYEAPKDGEPIDVDELKDTLQ